MSYCNQRKEKKLKLKKLLASQSAGCTFSGISFYIPKKNIKEVDEQRFSATTAHFWQEIGNFWFNGHLKFEIQINFDPKSMMIVIFLSLENVFYKLLIVNHWNLNFFIFMAWEKNGKSQIWYMKILCVKEILEN